MLGSHSYHVQKQVKLMYEVRSEGVAPPGGRKGAVWGLLGVGGLALILGGRSAGVS